MTDSDIDDVRYASYHEAGHLVAGSCLGWVPGKVVLRSDGTATTTWARSPSCMTMAGLQRELVMTAAGPMAEVILSESSGEPSARYDPDETEVGWRLVSARLRRGEEVDDTLGPGDDLRGAYRCAAQLRWLSRVAEPALWEEADGTCHADVLKAVVQAERWAEKLLRRTWDSVEAVAEALLASPEGCLSGNEVEDLIDNLSSRTN